MHRKYHSAHFLLLALALLLPGLLLPFTFLPVTSASPVTEEPAATSVQTHAMTAEEAAQMELVSGTYVNGTDYNQIVDGHGTGLAPPTSAEYTEMVGNVQVTDSVQTDLMSSSSYDISTQPYFPAVGDQGSQGSCAAWAMTYYDYGYLEARDNNWTDASTGNPAHLMSPAWTYNRADGGVDRGTFMDTVADIIKDWGVASMATMPYNANDLQGWGSEAAAREAPLHRALDVHTIPYSDSDPNTAFSTIKGLLSSNLPVTFALDANMLTNSLADNIITANEYNSNVMNHAQTIVGYDDAKTDGVHADVGAFKIVNSWGKNWGNHGYYWISYDAMKKIGDNLFLTYITDRPAYQPSLLAIIEFNNAPTRETTITVGVGNVPGKNKFVPYFEENYDASVTATFPSFLAIDMTDLQSKYQANNTGFYLTLGATTTAGNVSSFRIEQYLNGYSNAATQVSGQSADVPRVNPCSVNVSMTSYATLTPQAALDNAGLSFIGSGNALWSPETRDYHYGGSALQSGNVGNNDRSAIQTTVLGPSTVSFWWKASTQATDLVRFYVDSVNRANASGALPWTQVSLAIGNGTHVLKWEYAKDAAMAGNQDMALIDQVVAVTGNAVPTAPFGLAATVATSIQLNWSAPSSNGGTPVTSYNVYRGISTGTESLLASVPASSLMYTDPSALVNQNYFYQVTAVNSVGESSRSNEASGRLPIPVPSAPSYLTAVAGGSYIDLSWSSNGASLTGFHLYRGTAANGETLLQTLSSSARSARDGTAVAGTTYYYRMDAFNSQVSSSYSNEVSARVAVVPGAPTALTAVTGTGIHLTWTAPVDNGGSPVLGYMVYRGTSAGGETATPIGTPGTTVYDDLTAAVGTRYYYVVKANNAIGDSAASNEALARMPTVPGAPISLNATASGNHTHLSWTAPDNGGAAISRYDIYRGTFAGGESAVALGTTGTTSYDDLSAVVGIQYYYVVRALNSAGESASSNEASCQIIHAPDSPSSLTVRVTLGHDSLSWTAPLSNGGSPLTSYEVLRGPTADPATHVQMAAVMIPQYDDTQITLGQTYYYSVRAVNMVASSSASNVVSVMVKGLPGAPNTPTAQMSDGSVLLSWSAPVSDGYSNITGYKVYRSVTSGAESFTAAAIGTAYIDGGLTNGLVYYYRITAVNAMGESSPSIEVQASPGSVPGAPVITGTTFSLGTVGLSWSLPDDGGRTIAGFSVYRGNTSSFSSATLMSQYIAGNVYQDPTATVGSTYYYFVTAANSIGTSGPGSSGPFYVSGSPSPPLALTASIASDHVLLSWSAPDSTGSSSVSGYYVYRSLAPGQGTVIAHLGNVLSYSDAAVILGETYYYSVSAENQNGTGPLSAEVRAAYVLAPGSPSGLTVTGSTGTASLTWSALVQNGIPVSGYTVRVWTSGVAPSIAGQVGPDSLSFVIGGLTDGVQYWFTVSAFNQAGEGPAGPSVKCTIGSAPGAPAAVAVSVGNGSISVSWTPPTANGGLSDLAYHVWRSTTGASTLLVDLGGSARTYTDRTVVPGTTYRYTVTASNADRIQHTGRPGRGGGGHGAGGTIVGHGGIGLLIGAGLLERPHGRRRGRANGFQPLPFQWGRMDAALPVDRPDDLGIPRPDGVGRGHVPISGGRGQRHRGGGAVGGIGQRFHRVGAARLQRDRHRRRLQRHAHLDHPFRGRWTVVPPHHTPDRLPDRFGHHDERHLGG